MAAPNDRGEMTPDARRSPIGAGEEQPSVRLIAGGIGRTDRAQVEATAAWLGAVADKIPGGIDAAFADFGIRSATERSEAELSGRATSLAAGRTAQDLVTAEPIVAAYASTAWTGVVDTVLTQSVGHRWRRATLIGPTLAGRTGIDGRAVAGRLEHGPTQRIGRTVECAFAGISFRTLLIGSTLETREVLTRDGTVPLT